MKTLILATLALAGTFAQAEANLAPSAQKVKFLYEDRIMNADGTTTIVEPFVLKRVNGVDEKILFGFSQECTNSSNSNADICIQQALQGTNIDQSELIRIGRGVCRAFGFSEEKGYYSKPVLAHSTKQVTEQNYLQVAHASISEKGGYQGTFHANLPTFHSKYVTVNARTVKCSTLPPELIISVHPYTDLDSAKLKELISGSKITCINSTQRNDQEYKEQTIVVTVSSQQQRVTFYGDEKTVAGLKKSTGFDNLPKCQGNYTELPKIEKSFE